MRRCKGEGRQCGGSCCGCGCSRGVRLTPVKCNGVTPVEE